MAHTNAQSENKQAGTSEIKSLKLVPAFLCGATPAHSIAISSSNVFIMALDPLIDRATQLFF